jgi:class 3 adenylate cyclase
MPMYIDIHDIKGASAADIARAHALDVQLQDKYGVNYFKYWVNEKSGKAFCMCTAPSAEAADAVHREAHEQTAARIMEVTPEIADVFMGAAEIDGSGAVLLPESSDHDPGTRTVLFTDIVGSTNMTQRLGDEIAMRYLEVHNRIAREALAATSGREVKHTGDGIMAVFHSAASAVRCGIKVQQDLLQHRNAHPEQPLRVRIGMAAGEPIEKEHDFFGSAVQLAARLCAHAEPEQILLSNAVAELCIGKALPLRDAGEVALKGFEQPVRFFAVVRA